MVSLSKLDSVGKYHTFRDIIYRHLLFNKLLSYRLLGLFFLHDFLVLLYNLYYYRKYNFNTIMFSSIDFISSLSYSLFLLGRIYFNITSEKLKYSIMYVFNIAILCGNIFFIGYYARNIYLYYMLPLTVVWVSLIVKLSLPFISYIIINFIMYKIFNKPMSNNEKIIFYNMSFYRNMYINKTFFEIIWNDMYNFIPQVNKYDVKYKNKMCRLCDIKYIKYDLIIKFPCGHSAHTNCLPDDPNEIKELDDCSLIV